VLIEVKPNWKKLEALYAPTPDEVFDSYSSDEQEALITDHFHEYAPRNLKIRDKDGALVPFKMNKSQLYLHWILQIQKRKTGRNRVIMLKGRQWGGSTYTEAWFYHETTKRFGCNTFIFSHEDKSTRTLYEMVERFHQHDDPHLRPVTGKSNAQELVFPLLDSKYEMATAGKKDAARSKRITLLHWSEMASSPNADGHKRGLLQTVPDKDGTAIVKESTANGVGNTFHEDWLDAINPETGWDEIGIFVPWYWHEEYRRKVPEGFERSPEEQELVAQYELDDEQLMFRRWKTRTMKGVVGNRADAFKQEYPMNWQEAFLFSGSNRFRASDLKEAEKHLRDPLAVYSVDMSEKPFKIVHNPRGELSIYEMPNKQERGLYGIGADVAKGLEHGDDSVGCAANMVTGETVWEWSGKIPSHEFGDLLNFLGHWTGQRVEICVETTGGYGDNTVKQLQRLHYSHLYYTERRNRDGSSERRVGFDTTKNSKPRLIAELDEDLINEPHVIVSKKTWVQMGTFVRKFNETNPHMAPKEEAQNGKHDDHVIARALASLLYHRRTPRAVGKKEKVRKRIIAATKSGLHHGEKLYRSFQAATNAAGPVLVKPAREQLDEIRTVDDMKRAVQQLREDSPIKAHKPHTDVSVPDLPARRQPRRLGG